LTSDEVRVQLLGEEDRNPIADGELHPDHGRDAELDQRRRHPGVGVVEGRSRSLTRVEHHEPQPALVRQQVGERCAVDLGRGALCILEIQHAVAGRREVAVPDVMEDVVAVVAQRLAQPARRSRFEPVEFDAPEIAHLGDRLRNSAPLGIDVEGSQVVWAGDDAEDAYARLDRRGWRQHAGIEPAHEWCVALAGEKSRAAVEELPRHAQKRRGIGERE